MGITEMFSLIPWNGWLVSLSMFAYLLVMIGSAPFQVKPTPFSRSPYKIIAAVSAVCSISLSYFGIWSHADVLIAIMALVLIIERIIEIRRHRLELSNGKE